MKFRKSPLVIISLRYGAIAGLLITALLIILFYIGQHPMMISPYLDFRILLFGIFIFFCLKEYRENYQDGILYFWQGMIGSYLLIFTSMIIASLGIFVFGQIDSRFVKVYVEMRTKYMESFSAEDIKMIGQGAYDYALKALPLTSSWDIGMAYFGQGIVIGLFISIILTAILRKQPKTL